MIELLGTAPIDLAMVGGKAVNLNALISLGLRVPQTLVIPVGARHVDVDEVAQWLGSVVGTGEPWRLAIRSSSAFEDTKTVSNAGRFLSLLGEFNRQSLRGAFAQVQQSGLQMGVLVQPLIDAMYAGVLFSCDPLTFRRDEYTIAWTAGLGDRLVAGEDPGQRVRLKTNGEIVEGEWPATLGVLDQLVHAAHRLEQESNCPVDIEWVVDAERRLWFVQSRPVVLPESRQTVLDESTSFDLLPGLVQQHHKIRLRRHAAERGVLMAPAIVECWSGLASPSSSLEPPKLGRAAAASVVLLHPERVNRQVVREFAPLRGSDVEFFTRGCRRYAIRRYPSVTGATAAKRSVLEAGLADSWVAIAIVQAVWDAYATGIIRRSRDGYIIDIAQGHFVPKGIVPTSTIVLSKDKGVISAVWREQPMAYRFFDGHVVTETPPEEQLELDGVELGEIARAFDPLFDVYENAALEFGLVEHPPGYRVYLIDVAEGDGPGIDLDTQLISSGVLSAGTCRGRVHRVNLSAIGALDSHLHDRLEQPIIEGGDVIVVAERASVDLLPYVGAPGVVGFVFERGSVLAHLAVVLREKGIPAIIIEDRQFIESLASGSIVELDASRRSLLSTQRISVEDGKKR